MGYVNVPRDLDKIKSKFALGLTAKQIGHIAIGAAIGIPMFFLARNALGMGPSVLIMMLCIGPFAFLGLYEKDGLTAKQWLQMRWRHMTYPHRRVYKSQNFYDAIEKNRKGQGYE